MAARAGTQGSVKPGADFFDPTLQLLTLEEGHEHGLVDCVTLMTILRSVKFYQVVDGFSDIYRHWILQWLLDFGLPEEDVAPGYTPEHSLEGRYTFAVNNPGNEPANQIKVMKSNCFWKYQVKLTRESRFQ